MHIKKGYKRLLAEANAVVDTDPGPGDCRIWQG